MDFDKLEPKADVIEKSEVLQLLKEEENEPEKKKLSTFLQVPNRPKIKPKEKPKEAKEPPKQPEPQTENKINQEVTENGEEQQTIESDQPNTEEDIKEPQLTDKEQLEENELPEEQKEENEINAETVENPQIEEPERANEDKLLEIQSQLTALLQLPVVMQQQLSFIQQQLTNIVQQKIAELNPVSTAEDTDAEKEGMKDMDRNFMNGKGYYIPNDITIAHTMNNISVQFLDMNLIKYHLILVCWGNSDTILSQPNQFEAGKILTFNSFAVINLQP